MAAELRRSDLAREACSQILRLNDRIVLTRFMEQFLKEKGFDVNSAAVLANFDQIRFQVQQLLKRSIHLQEEKGITPRYQFSSVDDDVLIPQNETSIEIGKVKIKDAIHSLYGRPGRGFELFCVHFLQLIGVEKCKVMRGTKEEGIDLFGVLNLGLVSSFATWRDAAVRILGQVKLSDAGKPWLKLFDRDLQLFREKEGEAWKLVPSWFKEMKLPLVGIFISGREFTEPARKWARNQGIAVKDLDQLIEDLLKFPNRTPGVDIEGRTLSFDKESFKNYFREQKAPASKNQHGPKDFRP